MFLHIGMQISGTIRLTGMQLSVHLKHRKNAVSVFNILFK